MPAGRHLFAYWRAAGDEVAEALEAARSLQHVLRARHPGLRAALFVRADGDLPGEATLMETYACETGIDAALHSAIEAAAAEALQRFVRGRRHLEVFDAA